LFIWVAEHLTERALDRYEHDADEERDKEIVFELLIDRFQRPLRWFEALTIFGHQIASWFYFTNAQFIIHSASKKMSDSEAAAEAFVQSWVTGKSLSPETFPTPPRDVAELYETHKAIAEHPMVTFHLGGHAGYKLGAPGGAGEPSICGPLFGNYLVPAPGSNLSSAAINLWQIEPEFGVVMGEDLPARTDGAPHSVENVWAAVQEVVLCVECCGRRGTEEAYAGSTDLGRFADTLFSGGVVFGDRLSAKALKPDDLLAATELFVNGELLAQGSGEKCLYGGPVPALTWLANHLNGRGLCLKKGQLVITGQTCMTQAVKVGDGVKATFGEFGTLEMIVH
jgi:2-keto-4-pentenoate hydratase